MAGTGTQLRLVGALGALLVIAALAWARGAPVTVEERAAAAADQRPNIVFVLTDDLSADLLRFMPNVRALERDGATFSHYYVTDSLCCPSRASIFTGEYPHNTDVASNNPPHGGYATFTARGDYQRVYARSLQIAGYRTSLMGKYLNGYSPDDPPPPFWDDWEVQGSLGYSEYGYSTNRNGKIVRRVGYEPQDYLTTVLQKRAGRFIGRAGGPFALEVSTFSPHEAVRTDPANRAIRNGYAVPAPRDDKSRECRRSAYRVPRGPSYNVKNRHAPKWLDVPRLYPHGRAILDARYCKRAQAVESIDRMVGALRAELRAEGLAKDTYFVFSSDNGFHTGQHRLGAGKMTAFEEDIRVPLIVAGPGIEPGAKIDQMTSNIDLAPTFEHMAGAIVPPSVDGHSLLGLLHDTPHAARGWPKRILVEHRYAPKHLAGPDAQPPRSGDPPSYRAIRGRNYLYVQYSKGPRGLGNRSEYYRLRGNAYAHEIDNSYAKLPAARRRVLEHQLRSLHACHGTSGKFSCWTRAGGS